ncbi:MAG: photosynthetic complex assembly protein PuhC, partial [Massilia sp.]
LSTRQLRFEDRDDGSIAVLDAKGGALLYTVAPGTNGFLRSTMRGLVRERKREGQGPELPFELLGRTDGRLTLLDPATGRRIDLESFGTTNSAVFARLLPTPQGADHVAHR